jgi:hypothetical protein
MVATLRLRHRTAVVVFPTRDRAVAVAVLRQGLGVTVLAVRALF